MKRLAALLIVLLVVACAHKSADIYTPTSPIPAAAQALPLERIEALIRAGASQRNWVVQRQGPGHLVATQTAEKFSATVDITFDRQSFRIAHRASTGLLHQGNQIHAHYNFWVRNLEADIRASLNRGS